MNLEESKAKHWLTEAKEAGMLVQYDREVAAADEKYGPIFEAYAEAQSIEDISNSDEEATSS